MARVQRVVQTVALLAAVGVGLLCVRVLLAVLAGSGPVSSTLRAEAVLDADARVPTRPLPVCAAAPAAVKVLREAGAHPRLDPEGAALWFDALDGPRRQLFRLDLVDGTARCWTCDEPGNNTRPYPGAFGVVFETDRHADDWLRANTELHFVRSARGEPSEPSRRLTRSAGPDDHPLLVQGGRVVWSRRNGAGYEVVWAPLQSAHGALLLGAEVPLARGGAAWLAPADWSPDARALVLLRGNPFAATAALAIDFATGEERLLHPAVARGGVAFNADGAVVAVAATRNDHPAARLPAALGTQLTPLATRRERSSALHAGTSLQLGLTDGELAELALPEVDTWGAPTGVALSQDGATIYLSQRSASLEERIVEILRDCD